MKHILQKLWLGIMTLIILIISIVWLFQVGMLKDFYITQRKKILLEEAIYLSESLSTWNPGAKLSFEVHAKLTTLTGVYDTRMLVLDVNNNFVLHPDITPQEFMILDLNNIEPSSRPATKGLHNFIQRLESRSNTAPTFSIIKTEFPPNNSILVTAPIYLEDIYKGKVILFMPLAPIDEATAILQKQLSIISIISLIIGSLVALLLSSQFTKPILVIKNATKQIASGNFNISVPVTTKDEMGTLAKDINDMALQLGKTDQSRRDFVANVSHDLKTPITLIQTYAEFIIEKSTHLSEEDKEYLEVIHDESMHLNHIVEDLLYLSKIESNAIQLDLEPTNLRNTIETTERSLRCMLDQHQIKVCLETTGTEFEIKLDRHKIQRVIFNLIHNVIQHASDTDKIRIKVEYLKPYFRFEIKDYGQGIPEEDLPHIWDRFYRVDKSRNSSNTPNFEGSHTGIGMSIVKQILIKHHFDYGIKSKIGAGTLIWFEGHMGENY